MWKLHGQEQKEPMPAVHDPVLSEALVCPDGVGLSDISGGLRGNHSNVIFSLEVAGHHEYSNTALLRGGSKLDCSPLQPQLGRALTSKPPSLGRVFGAHRAKF